MRLAHLILAHNKPGQLERLIKRLISANADIYIHLDAKSDLQKFIHLKELRNVFFIENRTSIIWADFSMITATLVSFEEIVSKNIHYSHLNLLSGQDYAIRNAAQVESFLFNNADKSFMRFKSIMDDWKESASRITKYHLGDYNIPFKFRIQSLINKLLPDKTPPNNLKPYGFSQWMSITPAAASYVIAYIKKYPSVKRFFKLTWGADELFFQTILLNSEFRSSIVNDHLRYIKFVKQASRPNTLKISDGQTLLDSGKFYARKFDEDEDSLILDFLDQQNPN